MKALKEKFNSVFRWTIPGESAASQKSVVLNPFRLKFNSELEAGFLENYFQNSIIQIYIASIAGVLFFSSFIIFDYFLVPEYFQLFLTLRIGVGSLIAILAILLIYKAKDKKISQPVLSCAIILVGCLNLSFIVIAHPTLNDYYYVGIILIYFWSYIFLKLRFYWASFTGLTIFLLYVITTLFIVNVETEIFLISTFFLLTSNFAGIGIAYALEYYARKGYFQNISLKKSIDENQALNKKINEHDRAIGLAEEKLTLLSKALESAANSITILNREGNIIWCNKAFSILTGYTKDDVIGKNPRLLKSGKHDRVFYKNLWSTVLSGNVWSGEIINKKKNGELYYEEMMITPVSENGAGSISHFIAIKQDISPRKNMEEELFESEKRLRSLFENTTMGIYRSTLDGDIVFANDALIKMLGFSNLYELQNRDKTEAGYVKENQRDEFLKALEESGTLKGFESEWQKKDGSVIVIRESARLDYDDKNNVIFEGTVEDITLSRLAQIEIKKSQERLQTVFDNLYDAIIIHDNKGRIISVNNKVLDYFNISSENAIGSTLDELFVEEDKTDILSSKWNRVINEGKTFKFEWKTKRPIDNATIEIEVFLSRITFGTDNYVLANLRDVTEQKEANRQLILTQKAVELNASPIFWINSQSEFIYANNAALKKLGFTFNEIISMKVSDIDQEWTEEFWREKGLPMLKSSGESIIETTHINKKGEKFPVEINASILNHENEAMVIAIVNDITERKKAAASLIEAKEKAEQSDKLKSDFLAGMSHEIRTPINTILNFISLIRSDLGDDTTDEIKSSFEMIDNGSRRLIRTIDSILNMSQLQSGSYELKIELLSVVEDILNNLMSEFKQAAKDKNLEFNINVNTDETSAFVDHYTISQLFVNLIDNAIKYTNEGSVNLIVSSNDEELIISVNDTGIGISEEFLPTLFEPFLQEEMGYTRSFEGNGLGLALVKKYVDLNNGSITVKSEKGKGSEFTVKLKKPTEREVNVHNLTDVLRT